MSLVSVGSFPNKIISNETLLFYFFTLRGTMERESKEAIIAIMLESVDIATDFCSLLVATTTIASMFAYDNCMCCC